MGIHLPYVGPLCLGCLACDLILSPLCTCIIPPCHSLMGPFISPPHHWPSYPLWCTSSLHLAVGSPFCQYPLHILDYIHLCGCYLVVSVGWGELSVFLLCCLPWKSLEWYLFLKVVSVFKKKSSFNLDNIALVQRLINMLLSVEILKDASRFFIHVLLNKITESFPVTYNPFLWNYNKHFPL